MIKFKSRGGASGKDTSRSSTKTSTDDKKRIKTSTDDKKSTKGQIDDKKKIKRQIDDKQEIKTPTDDKKSVKTQTDKKKKIKELIDDKKKIKEEIDDKKKIKEEIEEKKKIKEQDDHKNKIKKGIEEKGKKKSISDNKPKNPTSEGLNKVQVKDLPKNIPKDVEELKFFKVKEKFFEDLHALNPKKPLKEVEKDLKYDIARTFRNNKLISNKIISDTEKHFLSEVGEESNGLVQEIVRKFKVDQKSFSDIRKNISDKEKLEVKSINANSFMKSSVGFLKSEFDKENWHIENYEKLSATEIAKIKDMTDAVAEHLKNEHFPNFKGSAILHKQSVPTMEGIVKAVPLALGDTRGDSSVHDVYKKVYQHENVRMPPQHFYDAMRMLNPAYDKTATRTSSYMPDIVNVFKNEYAKKPWDVESYDLDKLNPKDKATIDGVLDKTLERLKETHPKMFAEQKGFHPRDKEFLSRVAMATPLIIDKKYDHVTTKTEIYKTVYDIKKEDTTPGTHFSSAVEMFYKDFKDSKFYKFEFKERIKEETSFLEKQRIDVKSLESRWAWMDKNPELAPRFYRHLVDTEFGGKSPSFDELKETLGGGFRGALKSKVGLTLRDLQKEAGLSHLYDKAKIDGFFRDKKGLESQLVKNLCHTLNYGIPDIGREFLTRGKSLIPNLIEKEVSSREKRYIGFSDDNVAKLKDFLNKLPGGDHIKDDFSEKMALRKEKALEIFDKYLTLRDVLKERSKVYDLTHGMNKLEFKWNKSRVKDIADDSIRVPLEKILKDNQNYNYPDGALLQTNPRCSRFEIKGTVNDRILPEEMGRCAMKLISKGSIVRDSKMGKRLVDHVKIATEKMRETQEYFNINGSLKHAPLLNYVMKNEKNALAKEIFGWKPINDRKDPRFVTGHIDIVLNKDGKIYISDYKPNDYNFLKSVPQVASYGFLISHMGDIDINKIKCITFNENEAWEYSPTILHNEVKDIVEELKNKHPSINQKWENI